MNWTFCPTHFYGRVPLRAWDNPIPRFRYSRTSFRPEFYTTLGIEWVMNNGPGGPQWEAGEPNGHRQQVLPFKRVLLRTMPELEPELRHVVNAFDPWARDRGDYYSLQWKPRPDAVGDEAFN